MRHKYCWSSSKAILRVLFVIIIIIIQLLFLDTRRCFFIYRRCTSNLRQIVKVDFDLALGGCRCSIGYSDMKIKRYHTLCMVFIMWVCD